MKVSTTKTVMQTIFSNVAQQYQRLLMLLLFVVGGMSASAQIAAWQLNGAAGSEASINASTVNTNLNTPALVRNGGVNTNALANAFGSTNYTASGTRADAVNNNRGMSFTISAKPGFQVSLSTLDVRFRRSGTGPNAFIWRYSTDGTNFTDIGSDISYTATTTGGDAQAQINLSGITALQNVASGTTITIRLNGWGASATGGTFAIGRSLTNGATDYSLSIGGTVASLATAPTVTTTAASNITTTAADAGGNVTADGGASVTARGVVYNTAPAPTLANSVVSNGSGTGSYSIAFPSLSVNTRYYYRAYATNSVNTSYGSELNFYTLADVPGTPTVNGATATSLDVTLDANGNPSITEYAIFETSTAQYVQSNGTLGATAAWQNAAAWGTKTVTGLTASTTYTFQVKARNGDAVETAFGATASGTTSSAASPNIAASALTAFGANCINGTYGPNTFTITGTNLTTANVTVATLNGFTYSLDDISYAPSLSIPQAGGSFSQLVYVKFSPTAVQSYNGNIVVGGGGASNFNVSASGSGINTAVSVTTGSSSGITEIAATLNGSYTGGCSAVTAYGIEYSTLNGFSNGSGTQVSGTGGTSFSASLSGLNPNTTYYYKAYATDGTGTVYGSQSSFVTTAMTAPVATAATAVTSTGFTANWNAVTGATGYQLDVSTASDFLSTSTSTIIQWSFPTSGATVTPDVANAGNTTKTLTSTGGGISDAAGLTTRAASANAWQSGSGTKYWQIDIDATGLYGLTLSSRQLSSNTGPRDFKLQYKVGAGAFQDVPSGTITVLNDSWVSGTVADLALPAGCDNQSAVSIRWIMTSNTAVNGTTVAAGGTSRIDNIVIKSKTPFFVAGYNSLSVAGTSQAVTGLSAGTTYYYRVRATSPANTTANSNTINVTTCYSIVASSGSNGNVTPSGPTEVCAGGNQTYTITPDACYSIADVLVDGVSQGAISTYTFSSVAANHTISASFALSTYAITVTAGSNGTVTPGTGNVDCGTDATYTITADACYHIDDVIVDGVSQGPITTYTFTNVTAPHTISATFAVDTYTITVSAGANGSITPSTGSVNCGSNATYTITPDPGYNVDDVIVDGVSQGAITTYTFNNVGAVHSISASFVLTSTFDIVATAGANGSISPSGTTTVNSGNNQSYTITADPCYSIADVLVDGVSQGAISTYTFTNVLANHTISASFVLNTYAITVTAGSNGSITPGTGNVNCGSNATYTITPDACYSIVDVVVDGSSQGPISTYTFTNVGAAHTISATFAIDTYTIAASAGANGSISPSGTATVNCGSNNTYTITPDFGYQVADVLVDAVSQGPITTYSFNNISANHTISVSFSAIPPSLSAGTLAAFGSVCTNTTAGPNTVTITGSFLTTADVTVGPLSGFSFSTDDVTYAASLSIPQAGGAFSQLIYVKFSPTAVQSYDGSIPVAGGGASSITVSASGSGINTAPSVTTGTASGVTQVAATLNGSVTAVGCTAVSAYGIEYSTLNGFSNGSGTQVAGSGGSSFTASLSGLSPNTTYYYKAYATNDAGTSYGAQASFTTLGLDAPVATAGTDITSSSFTANWNAVTGADSYRLDVSTSSSFVGPSTTVVAGWSFPTSGTIVTPDVFVAGNSTKTLTTNGGTITSLAGATTQSAAATAWQSGNGTKFWQVDVDATGYYNLTISSKQQSSNTGPRDFKLQYRTGGVSGTWTDVPSGAITVAANFTTGVVTNLALPAACDNQSALSIRWIMTSNTSANGGTVASGGTNRIDDISVKGGTPLLLAGYNNLTVNGLSQSVTGLTAGTNYYYRVRAFSTNSTSANSNTIAVATCVLPNAGTISGTSPLCIGGTASFTSNGDAGGSWSSDNESAVTVNPTTGLVTGVAVGSAVITYTVNGCSSTASATFNVTVNPNVNAGTVTGSAPLCIGGTATFTSDGDAGGTWSSDNTGVATVDPNTGLVTAIAAGSANISYTISSGCGSPASASASVTVNPNVNAGTVSGPAALCVSTTGSFTTNGDAGGTWSSSNTAVATVNPTTGLVSAVGAGSTSISYTISTGCGSPATASTSLSVAVNTAPVVSGPTNVCPFLGNSTQVTYTANTPGASGYTWILPPNVNLISGAGTSSIVVTFNAAFGTQANKQIRVTANGVCGTSAQTIYYLLVQYPTTPAAITASSLDVCSAIANASSITFTIPKVSTATSYIWTSQAGTTVVTHPNGTGVNDTTITVTFSSGFTTSAITVTAVNDCGTSGVRSITLTRANPSTPSLISGPTNACAFISPSTTSATYSIPQQPNVSTYTWTIPVGATNVVGQGTNTISFVYPAGYTGGTISVIASNGCGTSGARSLAISTLSPATPGVIDVINTAPCPDRTYTYSVASMPSNATSLNWTIPAAGTLVSGQGTTSITVSYPATAVAGTVSVVAVNNCGNSVTRSVDVKLAACPPPSFTGLQQAPAKGSGATAAGKLQVTVYPNPSDAAFNLTVNTVGTDRITVKVSDVQGRVLQQLQVMPSALKQVGADLKPGTYFLEITQGNSRQVQKLIKL